MFIFNNPSKVKVFRKPPKVSAYAKRGQTPFSLRTLQSRHCKPPLPRGIRNPKCERSGIPTECKLLFNMRFAPLCAFFTLLPLFAQIAPPRPADFQNLPLAFEITANNSFTARPQVGEIHLDGEKLGVPGTNIRFVSTPNHPPAALPKPSAKK